MNLNAVILVLLGAITNVESKFVPSPYATINDNNRGSTAVAPSPYATINDNNRGSTTVAKRKLSKKNTYAVVSKDIAKSIEGLYYYLGSCASIYKVII